MTLAGPTARHQKCCDGLYFHLSLPNILLHVCIYCCLLKIKNWMLKEKVFSRVVNIVLLKQAKVGLFTESNVNQADNKHPVCNRSLQTPEIFLTLTEGCRGVISLAAILES